MTPAEPPPEPSVETVVAAQRGDQRALDDLIAGYLPLIYNVVGHALGGHADTDDVVQETMLRAVHGLTSLRDPASFRSWLVVIAMNLVRDRHRQREHMDIEQIDVADPGADFVDLTILRLQLSGERREVVVGIAEHRIDHGGALEVVADLVLHGHADAAVQLDRLLADEFCRAPDLHLGGGDRLAAIAEPGLIHERKHPGGRPSRGFGCRADRLGR